MLWPFVEQVLAIMLAEEYAGRLREARFANVLRVGPAGRAVGRDQARLPRAPDRHANRHQHGDKTAAARDGAAGVEHARRVGVEEEPPLEQRSEEHTSELQSLMLISYAVFCLKK